MKEYDRIPDTGPAPDRIGPDEVCQALGAQQVELSDGQTIVLRGDVRLFCPKCQWEVTISRLGLGMILSENDGELPIHRKCKVRLEAVEND